MAPLDEFRPVIELDDEQRINGQVKDHFTTTTWISIGNEHFDDTPKKYKQTELEEAEMAPSSDENLKLSDHQAKSRNYGTCRELISNTPENISSIDKSKLSHSLPLCKSSSKLDFQQGDQFTHSTKSTQRFDTQIAAEDLLKMAQQYQLDDNQKKKGIDEFGDSDPKEGENLETQSFLERAAGIVPGLGIILALCASVSLGTAGMLVKMTHSCNGIQVAVLRSLIQVLIYGLVLRFRRLKITPETGEWVPVFGRALLGACSMCFTYYALNLIPLGDATAIRFSLPIWSLIISYFFLGETCQFTKILAVFVAVLGVVMIAKPDDCVYLGHLILRSFGWENDKEFALHKQEHAIAEELKLAALNETTQTSSQSSVQFGLTNSSGNIIHETSMEVLVNQTNSKENTVRHFEGAMLALASSIMLSLSLIAMRLARKTPAEVTIFWLSILSVLIGNSMSFALNEWSLPNNSKDVMFIILNGLCGSAGQWFITNASKIEQSGIIALARTFDIEVAFLYSAFLLQEEIKLTSVIGAIFVSLGVVIVVVPKWLGWESNDPVEDDRSRTFDPPPPRQSATEIDSSILPKRVRADSCNTMINSSGQHSIERVDPVVGSKND